MRVIKERSAVAGKKAVKDNNSQPKPSIKKDSESSPLASLGQRLRQWGRDHTWYQLGYIKNHLALKRAFSKSVSVAVDGFLSQGQVRLALQIKTDFESLLDRVKRFDVCCREGCAEEDELAACECLQEQIHTAIDDLAALLDNRDLGEAAESNPGKAASARPTTTIVTGPEQWLTFAKTAELLAVGKGTVSKWARLNRFIDNGLKGQRRRLSKLSVLMVKQEIEDKETLKDVKDIRMDARIQTGRLIAR